MWRKARIVVLLFILATVAQTAWLSRVRSVEWREPLRVAIYPVVADGSAQSGVYVDALRLEQFAGIETFFADEARRHGLTLAKPVEIMLAPRVNSVPPAPPRNAGAFDAIVWTLSMRWWAWRNDEIRGIRPQVRMFVLYFDGNKNSRLAHSVGLQEGLIGRVNAFANEEMTLTNNVIIAHELLHTLGATDKYDAATSQPVHPGGYAEPQATPLHPQRFAELMGGRIPLSPQRAEIPESLAQVLVGGATAREIRWLR